MKENNKGNFSVLIGLYSKDNPTYFKKAMDSILQQTIKSNDIVLSIDGPITGNLLEVAQKYIVDYPEIHPLWLPENIGQGRAFQKALPLCTNEIIFRMDADDISASTRFEKQLEFLNQHPEVKLLSSTISEFRDDIHDVISVYKVPTTNDEIVKTAKRRNPINQPSAVFYKSAVLEVGGYQDFYRHEDIYLWIRMMLAGYECANIEESLLYYRVNDDSFKRRYNLKTLKSVYDFNKWTRKVGFCTWKDSLVSNTRNTVGFLIPVFLLRIIKKLK